jgi:integrase
MAENAFALALIKSGIAWSKEELIERGWWERGHIKEKHNLIPDGRRLIPHSLRYTYVTRMRQELDADTLKKLTGHESVGMVDYYNKTNLEMALAAIPRADTATKALLPPAIMKP